MSNNLRRILTALVAAPAVVGIAYVGGWTFVALIAAIGLVGQVELYRMARTTGALPNLTGGGILGVLLVATLAWPSLWPVAVAWLIVFVVLAPFLLPQDQFLASFSTTLVGAVYPSGLLGSLVLIRAARSEVVDPSLAFWLVVLTFLLVWATDIFAYYVGKWVGQRALAPSISPNKTWEGTLGGLSAAVLVAIGFKLTVLGFLTWPHVAALALIGGGVSQVGDLMESQLKRSTGADDSSSILPGHGGILDRFDAMLVAAPLTYLYLRAVMGVI
ncbi:MAG: phosphatidate cytidylyltransferase [Bacteroidetes bacterium SW_9_63_38]|nr:MAG: phosphatidate cytidylyltransferase [Bacteroidetes bacterium SW_9_63_38]